MLKILLYLVPLLLALYALIECALTPAENMPYRLPKPLWIIIVLLFTVIGPLAWIVLLRIDRAEQGESAPSPREVISRAKDLATSRHPQQPEPEAPRAPDDDEDYLNQVERQILREKRARQRQIEKERERQQREGQDHLGHQPDTDPADTQNPDEEGEGLDSEED